MRRWLVLAAVLALLAPGVASGETCTSAHSFRWTAIGTTDPVNGWTGCTASTDDDFVVASGHTVIQDWSPALTAAGSITNGGTYRYSSGTLTPGEFILTQYGGVWDYQGRVLAICTIIADPTWGAAGANPVITLDCPAASIAANTDFLYYLDEDPPAVVAGGPWKGTVVNPNPGRVPGAVNLSLNRWAFYDITNITGNAVTYDLDSGTHPGTPDQPYRGTRAATTAAIDPANITMTAQPGGRATQLEIDTVGHGASVVTVNGDLGSMYLYYPEDPANAADPTYCSGEITKLLHSEEGGATDVLFPIADVMQCTNASPRITPGARRGDKVALVRPAIIDGAIGGTNTSTIRIESGATVRLRYYRFINLGVANAATAFEPDLNRHCNICVYQSSTGPADPVTGWNMDGETAYFEATTAAQDSAVWSFQSKNGTSIPNADLRFPNAGQIDMSQFYQARLHIHDARNTAVAAGSHLWYTDGARGLCVNGLRAERSSDDLVGGNITGNITGTATAAGVASTCVNRALLYEAISERDTGQQGLEFQVLSQAELGVHSFARHAGFFRGKDIVVIGTYKAPVNMFGLGMLIDRIVSGGHFLSDDTVSRPFNIGLTTGASPLVLHETYPNIVENALIAEYAEDGASGVQDSFLLAVMKNFVLWGKEQSNDADDTLDSLIGCDGGFIYHAGLTTYMVEGNGSTDYIGAPSRTFRNCAFVSQSAHRVAQNFTNSSRAYTFTADRVAVYGTGAWAGATSAGCLGTAGNETGGTYAINGVFCSTNTPGTVNFTLSAAASTVVNACYESNDTAANDFGSDAGATTLSIPDLYPDASMDLRPGNIVAAPAVPGDTDTCERCKPEYAGLKDLGTAHVVMGSLFLKQLYPTFTSRTDLVTLVGDDTIVAPSGIYPGTIAK